MLFRHMQLYQKGGPDAVDPLSVFWYQQRKPRDSWARGLPLDNAFFNAGRLSNLEAGLRAGVNGRSRSGGLD
ncbi:hypothetical protein H9L39_17955 [Fusarium oxysporum f. sp. albedinis]|nr:hypothetical protein H9L39_17955 [Fusarium oxysporum f. sp. albedinis]